MPEIKNCSQVIYAENIQIQDHRRRNEGKEDFWAEMHQKKLSSWLEKEVSQVHEAIELLDKIDREKRKRKERKKSDRF